MSTRVATPVSHPESSFIAGSVLPIQRAEELLATLPGVISARIVASGTGSVEEIHILTTDEVSPKQTVRNVESALIAHLGMRVSHKKISVATSSEGRAVPHAPPAPKADMPPAIRADKSEPAKTMSPPSISNLSPSPLASAAPANASAGVTTGSSPRVTPPQSMPTVTPPSGQAALGRRLYFEDIEVRRSRSKGVACRVTLRKGESAYVGEAEGLENERLRIELAARATLSAITQAEGDARVLGLEGCKVIDAFDRQFVFVGLTTRTGRDAALLTGSAEVKESQETASVLAVLDATNRWIDYSK